VAIKNPEIIKIQVENLEKILILDLWLVVRLFPSKIKNHKEIKEMLKQF
jgi:RIO-like serine/threonine protein kinase